MPRIIDYIVISKRPGNLEAAVQERLIEGWTPSGSVVAWNIGVTGYLTQAMVKYENRGM